MKIQRTQTFNINEQQLKNPVSKNIDKKILTSGIEVLKLVTMSSHSDIENSNKESDRRT